MRITFKAPGGDKQAQIYWDGDELQISNHTAELKKLAGRVTKALGEHSIFEDHVTQSLLRLNETVVSQGEALNMATQDIADLKKELAEVRNVSFAELTSVQEGLQAELNATQKDLAGLEENVELNALNMEKNRKNITANVMNIESNGNDIAQNHEDIKTKGCRPGTHHDPKDSSKCLRCAPGTYNTNAGATECKGTPCAPGKYYPNDGMTSPVTCLACTPGTYASGTGNTGCKGKECSPGTWHEPGQPAEHTCKSCARGKWSADTGRATECGNCGAGRASNDEGRSAQCPKCLKGTAATSNTKCADCGPGTYSSNDGASSCSACNMGSFSSGKKNTKCDGCAPGRYSMGSATKCTKCGPGQYTDSPTASCSDCVPGKYSNGQSNSGCKSCGGGTYNKNYKMTTCQDCLTCSASQFEKVACKPDTNRECYEAWEPWTSERKCKSTYRSVNCASAEADCKKSSACQGYHKRQWMECTWRRWGFCKKYEQRESCELCNNVEHYKDFWGYKEDEYKIKKYLPRKP